MTAIHERPKIPTILEWITLKSNPMSKEIEALIPHGID